MQMKVKRITLLVIALSALVLSVLSDITARPTVVQAQNSATNTFTVTATGTATGTPTATTTGTLSPTPTTPGAPTQTPTFTSLPTFTPTFTPFGTPAPTPTKVLRVVNEITAPKPGDAVAGFVSIEGTALISAFRKYDMHIAVAGSEDWQWLTTSYTVVHDSQLYLLDSTKFRDGFYDVRVRAIRDDGNYSEAFLRHFEIRNANPPTPTPLRNAEGTLLPTQPPSPLQLVATPTPTPQPEWRSNLPNGQGIFAPLHNQVIRGMIDIIATVNGSGTNPFDRYELAYARAGQNQWQPLYSDQEQFWQESVYEWDTRHLPDGAYDLRLRIVYRDSNYSEYFVRNLHIANYTAAPNQITATPTPLLGIFIPASNALIGGIVEVRGVAQINNFAQWELAIAPSGVDQWSPLVKSTTPAAGLLARLDLSQLAFGSYDLRLRVISNDYWFQDYFARQLQVAAPTPTFTPVIAATLTVTTTLTPKP